MGAGGGGGGVEGYMLDKKETDVQTIRHREKRRQEQRCPARSSDRGLVPVY